PLLFPVSVSLRTLHCCPTRRSSDLKDNVDIIRSYAGRQYREPRLTQPARMGNKFAFPFSDFDSVEIAAHQRDTFGIPDRNDGVGHVVGKQIQVIEASIRIKNQVGFGYHVDRKYVMVVSSSFSSRPMTVLTRDCCTSNSSVQACSKSCRTTDNSSSFTTRITSFSCG